MIDQAVAMDQRAETPVNVLVVTERADFAARLRASARVLTARGVNLGIFRSLKSALAWRAPQGKSTLVFDAAADSSMISELPRHWQGRHPRGSLVLVTEHREPMFKRSARSAGYTECVSLEEAMRADFLLELLELNGNSRLPRATEPDFELTLGDAPGAILVAHTGGRVVFANEAFFEAVGLLPSNLRGVNLSTFFPEITPAMLAGSPIGESRLLECRRASGNSMMVEAHFFAPPGESGSYVAIRF